MSNSDFDVLASTTLKNYRAQLADNVSEKIALFYWLREKGRVMPEDGGTSIVEPLMHGLGSLQSWSGLDVLDAEQVDGITAAEYERKFASVPIVITDEEATKNKGKSRIISLLDSKVQQAEITMNQGIEEMWFGDGTGNNNKDMNGLQALIEVDATNASGLTPTLVGSGTVGGITRSSSNNYWQVYNNDGAYDTTSYDQLKEAMRKMIIRLSAYGGVDLMLTTDVVLAGYEGLLEENMRHSDNMMGDAGFYNVKYKGIPVVWSNYCPSGYLYYLNSTYLKFRVNDNWNFITSDFEKPARQFARYAYVSVGGNLTISRGNAFGLTHSID